MAVVRLVCCPAQTARERRIDRLLREHWGRALLVVPTQRYADDRAAGLLLAGDCPGIWGDLALTFDRFVERLLQGEGLHASAIDNLERKVILRRVLSSLHERGRLGPAGELADSDGLANHLLRIVPVSYTHLTLPTN